MVNSCLGLDFISATSGVIWVGIVGMTRGMTPSPWRIMSSSLWTRDKTSLRFRLFFFALETQDVCVSSDMIMMAKKREI